MAKTEPKKTVSRKHLARVEREALQRRYILIATIAIVVIVVILIAVGFVIEGVIKPSRPVAQVGDTNITTDALQARVRYQRYLYTAEYLNTYQFIQSMGDPNSFSYFESYLLQIQNELEPEVVGLSVLNDLIDDALIQKEAEARGIEVSRSEVEDRIEQTIFQYFPDGTPTPVATSFVFPTPTLSAIQKTLVPPTPTEVITVTPITEPTSTPTENPEIETDTEAEPTPTAVPPTPTAYTENAYRQNYKDFMSNLKSFARVSEEDIYDFYESLILREKVSEAVITDIPGEEEMLWARHILFQDVENGEQQAKDFLTRIETGEDFGFVAEEISKQDSESEEPTVRYEDLGWFGERAMVDAFDVAARALEVGEISEPVQTTFGWHVIQLLGRDTQPRSQADIDNLREQAFQEWLANIRAESAVDINPDWPSVVPDEPDIPVYARITPSS